MISRGDGLGISWAIAPQDAPMGARFSAYASERDYQPATHSTPATGDSGPVVALASSVVLEPAARAAIATRLAKSGTRDRLTVALCPAMSARLEVGDRFALSDGAVWRVDRLEGQASQTMSASRAPDSGTIMPTYLPPKSPPRPVLFSPPVLLVLDITAPFTSPVSPSPLVGCASQIWPGVIEVLVGERSLGTLTQPATIGALSVSVPEGPVGRLIKKPMVVKIAFGQSLPSAGQAALTLDGAVVDIISWRIATLIGEGLWQISDWVRGVGGAPVGIALPSGTTFVWLNDALQELPLDSSLEGLSLTWRARPLDDINRESTQDAAFAALARQPWPPCHVRARRDTTGTHLSWVRRARGTGDGWSSGNAPLGASVEHYRVTILSDGGAALRVIDTNVPACTYSTAQELADFGQAQTILDIEVCQIGDDNRVGQPVVETFLL
jgi:hypothetical protein